MCINPRIHSDGLKTPCRKCWQCRENRINDWTGRCIAERETAVAASFVTLTYGGGDCAESRFLRKSDMTAYFKAIRNAGHKVRFFYVGEYGSKKGRSHWHALLFWPEPMPFRELRKNISDEWWPHGFSYWDNAEIDGIRYVMKYINKDIRDDVASNSMGMSRKPVLGRDYFVDLAARYAAQGLSPQRPFYKFREVLDKSGKPIEFYMPPRIAEAFSSYFVAAWKAARPGKWWPASPMVDEWHERSVSYTPDPIMEKRKYRDAPWMLPPVGAVQRFDEKMNMYYAEQAGVRLYWSWDERGKRAWQEEIVTETEAERRAAAFEGRQP